MTITKIVELLIPSGVSVVFVSAALFLIKNWVQTRILKSIEHEYKEKALNLESGLRNSNDELIAKIKSNLDNSSSVLKASLEQHSFRSRKIVDREFESMDNLWAAFLAAKDCIPAAMRFYDALEINQLDSFLSKEEFRRSVQSLMDVETVVCEKLTDSHDILRPYVDQDSWVVFLSFRIIAVRIKLGVFARLNGISQLDWSEDPVVKQILDAILGPSDMAFFLGLKFNRYNYLVNTFESRILTNMRAHIDGTIAIKRNASDLQDIQRFLTSIDQNS